MRDTNLHNTLKTSHITQTKELEKRDRDNHNSTDKIHGFLKLSPKDREFIKRVMESDSLFYGEDLKQGAFLALFNSHSIKH